MIARKAPSVVACHIVVAFAVATPIIASVPAEAGPAAKPVIVRDHRDTGWQPKTPKGQKPPVVRDHRDGSWKPRQWRHPSHYH